MKQLNRNLIYNLFIIFLTAILFACDTSEVSISVEEMRGGKIEIDNKSIEYFTTRKFSNNLGDTLYYLRLNKGDHRLKVITNQLYSIDTTFKVSGGEAYIGIDMEAGEILF